MKVDKPGNKQACPVCREWLSSLWNTECDPKFLTNCPDCKAQIVVDKLICSLPTEEDVEYLAVFDYENLGEDREL